jgi:ubiquinol-cytochrome c reductase cytochrome c subunit
MIIPIPSRRHAVHLGLALGLGLGLTLSLAVVAASAPDDPDRDERLAAGKQAFRDNCLICHSEEMTARLRLTEKQWTTEVDKMIGWGSPVPAELKAPLLEFLLNDYSAPTASPVGPPERITPAEALALSRAEDSTPIRADLTRGALLYTTHCATCHGPEALGGDLGSCLVEKPVLVRPAEYHEVVRKGRRRMPGFAAALKPDQEDELLGWLRSRRFEPPKP